MKMENFVCATLVGISMKVNLVRSRFQGLLLYQVGRQQGISGQDRQAKSLAKLLDRPKSPLRQAKACKQIFTISKQVLQFVWPSRRRAD